MLDGDITYNTPSAYGAGTLYGADQDMIVGYDGTAAIIDTHIQNASDLDIDCGTDKTIELQETVWKDVFFPQAPPKTTGAGNPSLVSWNGNLRGYSYAINDVHDFDPQEFPHDGKEGVATGSIHIHWISRANDGTNRGVNWQIEFSQQNANAVFPAATTANSDITVTSGTAVNTHFISTITTFTTLNIASQMFVRLTRIASATAAPSVDPVVIGVHYHFEVDTIGSRQITTK